MAEAG